MIDKLAALRAWPLWLRLGVSSITLGAAYAFQIPLEREVPGEPFLLFFIVVIISALAFGEFVGFLACGASALLSAHFFEPIGSLAVYHAGDLIKIELYAVMCALSIIGVGRLRSAIALLYAAMSNNEKKAAILLEEMAHRTSNNFAVVAALMRSKASTVLEPDAKTILEDAVEQIITMARLNRNLHVANDAIAVDSESFVSDLACDLKDAMGKSRQRLLRCLGKGRFSEHRFSTESCDVMRLSAAPSVEEPPWVMSELRRVWLKPNGVPIFAC